MKALPWIVAGLALSATAGSVPQTAKKTTPVAFVFKSVGNEELPRTVVSLKVGKKVTVLKTVTGTPTIITDKEAWNKGAVTSCSSWWAGQGDQFYVKRVGTRYQVFHRSLEEENSPGKFKLIKTIRR